MWTLARPVRVAARLDWKVATAPSMRRWRSAWSSLSTGIPAMMESAIGLVLVYLQQTILANRGGGLQPGGGRLFVGVVAGADQGAGFDVAEAHAEGFGFEIGEFARGVEAGHGQMVARGAQILADGEDVAADRGEVAEDGKQLDGFLAESDHDAGFGEASGV